MNSNLTNEDETGFSADEFSDLMGIDEGAEEETGTPDVPETSDTTDTPVVDEVETPPVPEPVVDDAEDELTTLRKQNELLMQQLSTLSAETQITKTTENNVTEEPSSDVPAESLFGEWKFDDIIENEDSFKKFLGDFAKKIVTHAEERLLQKLPGTVSKLTTEQMETRKVVDTFYTEHSQLAAVKPFVAKVVSVVASEHADWDLPQVLEESASRAYKALGLKKQAIAAAENAGSKKPAFASPASGKRGVDPNAGKSKLEKELEELMELE